MKNVKKLLALLLALVMLFAFCACSSSNDKDDDDDDKKEGSSQSDDDDDKGGKLTESKLEGDWEATLDVMAIAALMGTDEIAVFDQLGIDFETCKLDCTFEDGECTLYMDGMVDWYVDTMEEVIDWCYEGDNMLEFVALTMSTEDEEYTADDVEAMLAEEGMTIDEILDQQFGNIDLDEMADEMRDSIENETMEYELDGDELIFDNDSVWSFSYSNNKIYVLTVEDDGETYKLGKGDFVLKK